MKDMQRNHKFLGDTMVLSSFAAGAVMPWVGGYRGWFYFLDNWHWWPVPFLLLFLGIILYHIFWEKLPSIGQWILAYFAFGLLSSLLFPVLVGRVFPGFY